MGNKERRKIPPFLWLIFSPAAFVGYAFAENSKSRARKFNTPSG
jgi:hypothetical protein